MGFDDDSKAHVVSLFDVENVERMPHVRDMIVGPVSTTDIREFAKRYHYTGLQGNVSWRWGLWHGAVLHGIVAYNLPTRSVCGSVFGPEHGFDKVWHMGRLILSDESPRNSESRLIGGSLREIERKFPNVWAVLTYAASREGHVGTVYQATNAIYTGETSTKPVYIDSDENHHPTYDGGHWVGKSEALRRGWTVYSGSVKHRYLYILGTKTQRRQRRALLKYDVLPYPKKGDDA